MEERQGDAEVIESTRTRLCSVCQSLNLKDLVLETHHAVEQVTKDARNKKRKYGMGDMQLNLEAGVMFKQHDNILQMREAASACDLCAEIWRCFADNAGLPPDLLEPELKRGLCVEPIYLLFSGDEWQQDRLPKLIALQMKDRESTRIIAYFDVCTEAGAVKPSDFPGRCARRLYTYSGSKECLSLVKFWMQRCCDNHISCKALYENAELPTRVIDVRSNPHLVDGDGTTSSYLALSYSWGGESALMLSQETESEFRKSLPPAALPPTIADTIAIAQALGIPYVWIDALCIFQDSPSDFLAETSRMEQIYRGATLTVNGSSAGKISDHIFTSRDYRYVKMQWTSGQELQEFVYLREDSQATAILLESCPVNWRGWCLQESLLATRSLWIGQRQMLFECTQTQSEETCSVQYRAPEAYRSKRSMHQLAEHEKSWIKSYQFRAWRIPDLIYFPYLTVSMKELLNSWSLIQALRVNLRRICFVGKLGKGSSSTLYDYWREIVKQYTLRQLTRPADVFPALSGLASAFSRATGDEYIAGHWKHDLAFSLLWSCRPLKQNLYMSEEEAQQAIQNHRNAGYLAPSWSWASMINGHVLFGPRTAGHQANSLRWHFYATESLGIVNVTTKAESSISPFGRVSGGQITLRCPFLLVPDPRQRPAQEDRLFHLRDYMYTFINENFEMSSKRYEFDIKHRLHSEQKFGLLRLGVYHDIRSSYQFWEPVSNDRYTAEVMLVESCEDDSTPTSSSSSDDHSCNTTGWRRLTLFDFYFNDARRYALPWATEELKADLFGHEWQQASLCLV